jgi:dTDP-4-dehydrorhamnose reductase
MRLLTTGGTGVLGRALRPFVEAAGHEFTMPGHQELDLFDPVAVGDVCRDGERVSAERFTRAAGWHPQ